MSGEMKEAPVGDTWDGLIYEGLVKAVNPVMSKPTVSAPVPSPIDGMFKIEVESSRGLMNLDLRPSTRTPVGEFSLPGFAVLYNAVGKKVRIKVGLSTAGGYTNYLCLAAEILD